MKPLQPSPLPARRVSLELEEWKWRQSPFGGHCDTSAARLNGSESDPWLSTVPEPGELCRSCCFPAVTVSQHHLSLPHTPISSHTCTHRLLPRPTGCLQDKMHPEPQPHSQGEKRHIFCVSSPIWKRTWTGGTETTWRKNDQKLLLWFPEILT